MRRRAISLHDVLLRHRWAIGLMESRRNGGPANLRHHDAVIASLRAGGMDIAMTAHAYSLLDGYIYGFALTKMTLPFETPEEVAEVAAGMRESSDLDAYPHPGRDDRARPPARLRLWRRVRVRPRRHPRCARAGRGFCARSGQLTEIDLGVDVGELVARVSLGIQLGLAPASAGVPKAIGSSAPDTGLLESGSVDGSTSYS